MSHGFRWGPMWARHLLWSLSRRQYRSLCGWISWSEQQICPMRVRKCIGNSLITSLVYTKYNNHWHLYLVHFYENLICWYYKANEDIVDLWVLTVFAATSLNCCFLFWNQYFESIFWLSNNYCLTTKFLYWCTELFVFIIHDMWYILLNCKCVSLWVKLHCSLVSFAYFKTLVETTLMHVVDEISMSTVLFVCVFRCKPGFEGTRCDHSKCDKYCLNEGVCDFDEVQNKPQCK